MIDKTDENVLLFTSRFVKQKEYWLTRLSGGIVKTEIRFDGGKKPGARDHGEKYDVFFPPGLSHRLIKISKQSDLSVYIILLAALKLLIYRYTHTPDITVASPINKLKISEETMNDMLMIRDRLNPGMTVRELILSTRESLLQAHLNQDYPFENVYEYLFDRPLERNNDLISSIVCSLKNIHDEDNIEALKGKLSFSFAREDDRITGHILYDTGVYGESHAAQLSRHFINILENSLEDVNVKCSEICFLSEEERRRLVYEFNDNKAGLPGNKTVCELFTGQVEKGPDNIAVSGAAELSYRELNEKAHRLAKGLLSCGVKEDHTVGIMLKRSPLMVASIAAAWKAGGAYIPIDTNYPVDRVAGILKDAGSTALITRSEYVESSLEEDYKGTILRLDREPLDSGEESGDHDCSPVKPRGDMNPLAYVIYTSGSTGKPKGAMVEHKGMMNHILAKIRDLHITGESIIAQNASHTFDISVWQFFTALTRGGKTVIYPDEVIFEPDRFIHRLLEDRVTVLEVVPSYLAVMLETLDLHPRGFDSLAYLLVTGEEVKHHLVERWFERCPGIKMVNAYGPTEASDDITHHVMDAVPPGNSIPIGKPLQNFNIYIVDPHMKLCAPGVKGEICVSGVGVGRGYLNNPEQTAGVFMVDPFRGGRCSGFRLYKTGDMGRRLPDGSIEFFGRKDNQVKIRGFRIELGEIETHLVKHEAVKEAVVIDREDELENKYLCAYVVPCGKLDAAVIKEYLSERLPEYMVPLYFLELEKIPLTPNGKIDRKALPDIGVGTEKEYMAPRNPVEEILVEVVGGVLGRTGENPVGIDENFFEIGGDSIRAIQIASRMYKAGYKIEMRDIFQNPTIAELAPRVTGLERIADQSVITGSFPLTPIQAEFFTKITVERHHYNQSVMLYSQDRFDEAVTREVLKKLQEHHDALRVTFKEENGRIVQTNHGLDYPLCLEVYDLQVHSLTEGEDAAGIFKARVNELQASIDLEKGPLMKVGLFRLDDGDRLLMIIHHLVVDGVSWRILFEDIEILYNRCKGGGPLELPLKTDSYKVWAEKLTEYANGPSFLKEKDYWARMEAAVSPVIPKDFADPGNLVKDARRLSFALEEGETNRLLNRINEAFGTDINDILLTALGLALYETYGHDKLLIALEGHGREEILKDVNINRTIGWFTSVFPVLLDFSYVHDLPRQIIEVKETLRRLPHGGLGYGILKYLTGEEHKKDMDMTLNPQLSFNYLGQFDADVEQMSFEVARESGGNKQSLDSPREHELEVSGIISGGRLVMSVIYSKKQYKAENVGRLLKHYEGALSDIIDCCSARKAPELTPGDLTYPDLSIETLRQLKEQYPLADIYPLSPMQEGMLFHALYEENTTAYFEQLSYRLQGNLDIVGVERSINELLKRYEILRTAFVYKGLERPLQVVLKQRKAGFLYEDIREKIGANPDEREKEAYIEEFKRKDRQRSFDLEQDVLMRVAVLRTAQSEYEFTWSFHHILMDGWCVGILIAEYLEIYTGYLENRSFVLPAVKPYRTYIQWLENRDKKESENYWANYLGDYEEMASIPGKKTGEGFSGYINQRVAVTLDKGKTLSLNQLAARNRVTVNTVIQTLWGILLSRYNGKRDVVFGAVVSGRPAEIPGVESMVGLFINTIPVRIRWEEGTGFNRLLRQIQEKAVESEPHHYYPLSYIQSGSKLKYNLLDHILIFENYPIAEQIDGMTDRRKKNSASPVLAISNADIFEQTNYDLNLVVVPRKQLIIKFDYNANAYSGDFVKQVADHFNRLIGHTLDNGEQPADELEILSAEEKNRLLVEFNRTTVEFPGHKTIHQLFEEQVEKTPDNTVVVYKEFQFTYRELNKKSNQLAGVLREKGVTNGDIVGIMADISLEMMVGIIGILKAGGAYLPVDPGYPLARRIFLLEDSQAGVLLTDKYRFDRDRGALAGLPPERVLFIDDAGTYRGDMSNPRGINKPMDLAYVIYTSGTSGKPKGVMIRHRGVVNYICWAVKQYVKNERVNFPLYTSISFDLTVTSVFTPLLSGNAVVVYGEEYKELLIERVLIENRVDVVKLTPSHLKVLRDRKMDVERSRIKRFIVGGEELETGLAADIYDNFKGNIEIYNEYGPTEATVGAMIYKFNPEDTYHSVPIGVPLDNTQIYILDRNQKPVPMGVLGELCISGAGLARGYLRRDELTAERFLENPFIKGEKLYRTGDLARYLPGGNIQFAGRMDGQVKIRGFRIELGEIENVLMARDGIKEAVVLDIEDKSGSRALCAYLVYKNRTELSVSELRASLAVDLPGFMIPAYYVQLEKIPLTANGKVDRRSLPAPEVMTGKNYAAPETDKEKVLVQTWKDVLGLDKVGVHDNFFELGGNSLLCIKIIGRLKGAFKRDIPIVAMFQYMTIRSFAQYLERGDSYEDVSKKDRSEKLEEGKNRMKQTMKMMKKDRKS
jgi:iturin family lipopeptide synthetase B